MANAGKQTMFIINVQEEEAKCTESQLDILLKIHDGQYRLVKKKKRSSVWNVYREIARPDGTKLKWRYYCLGCKRVMQSTGGTTSNLRIHRCHVRYLQTHGKDGELSKSQPITSRSAIPKLPAASRRQVQTYEPVEYSDEEELEENYEETQIADVIRTEQQVEHVDSLDMSVAPNERPLFKLFSEDECWSPETIEEQQQSMVEIDHVTEEHSEDFSKETIQPNPTNTIQIDANAVSEAESYARAWAHTFLKLSEDQKFYAKRSIDELLVLGRLERLNISTVTSLTTNL